MLGTSNWWSEGCKRSIGILLLTHETQDTCLLVHRYVHVKNTHGKYVPSELVWFNNKKGNWHTDNYTKA